MKRRKFLKALGVIGVTVPLVKPYIEEAAKKADPIRGFHEDMIIQDLPINPELIEEGKEDFIKCRFLIKQKHKILAKGSYVSLQVETPELIEVTSMEEAAGGYRQFIPATPRSTTIKAVISKRHAVTLASVFEKQEEIEVDIFISKNRTHFQGKGRIQGIRDSISRYSLYENHQVILQLNGPLLVG
jgi:hypothetical protein